MKICYCQSQHNAMWHQIITVTEKKTKQVRHIIYAVGIGIINFNGYT